MLQKTQEVFLLCLSRSTCFFINSISVCAGSFFVVAVYFCNASFNRVFRRFRILCFVLKLVLFKEFVKSLQGSMWKPTRIELKFCIPCRVVAVSNSILHPRRHIFIWSYNERKLQQGVKKPNFLIFHTPLLQVKKYHSLSLILPSFPLLFPITASHQITL